MPELLSLQRNYGRLLLKQRGTLRCFWSCCSVYMWSKVVRNNSFLIAGLESQKETFEKFVKMDILYGRFIVRFSFQLTLQHSKPFSLKTPTEYHIDNMKQPLTLLCCESLMFIKQNLDRKKNNFIGQLCPKKTIHHHH